jgi:hypothetical protein
LPQFELYTGFYGEYALVEDDLPPLKKTNGFRSVQERFALRGAYGQTGTHYPM